METETKIPTPPPERPRPRVKLIGRDGNAFAVMGACVKALAKAGFTKEERDAFLKEAMSGDYNKLLATAMKWCEVEVE